MPGPLLTPPAVTVGIVGCALSIFNVFSAVCELLPFTAFAVTVSSPFVVKSNEYPAIGFPVSLATLDEPFVTVYSRLFADVMLLGTLSSIVTVTVHVYHSPFSAPVFAANVIFGGFSSPFVVTALVLVPTFPALSVAVIVTV